MKRITFVIQILHINMKNTIYIFLILLFSLELNAQTKLIVFSEDNSSFMANINDDNRANEGSNFFEFINVDIVNGILKVVLENNQKLKKTITLKKGKQNVYSISNDGGFYEIQYRGYYDLNEDLPDFEFTKNLVNSPGVTIDYSQVEEEEELEIDNTKSKLVNVNLILNSLEGVTDNKLRTSIIVEELNKGKYNCRQLKFLFTKIDTDYSKLFIFKSTVKSCLDKENLHTLKSSFKSKKYQNEFISLVSKL